MMNAQKSIVHNNLGQKSAGLSVQNLLAQLRAEASPTCTLSIERAKTAPEDFYAIYNGTEQYSDADFTPDSTSLYWAEFGKEATGDMASTE